MMLNVVLSTLVLNVVLIVVLLLALTLVHSSLASGSSSSDDNTVETCTNEGTCTDSTNKVNMSNDLVSSNDDDGDIATQLIHWLRTNGAYINEKLTVRHINPADVTSPRGVFALEDMDAGELLCHIPHTLILKPSEDTYLDNLDKRIRLNNHNDTNDTDADDVEELDESKLYDCGAIDAVYHAMTILNNKNEAMKNDDAHDDSELAYVKYLLMQPKDYLPSFWSKHAKNLLNELLTTARTNHLTNLDQLPPRGIDGMIDRDIKVWCPNNKIDDDPLYRQAAMLVKARADFHYMVPFYDMFNHISDSTKYNIAHKSTPYGPVKRSGYEIITTRKIQKSEELYNSYNRCNICAEMYDYHGTPEVFLNYGFVESMPQRWLFDFARVKFDLDWKNYDVDDNESSTVDDMVVTFLVPPSKRGMALLQEELDRLITTFGTKRHDINYKELGIPDSEWSALWQYYDALCNALQCAIQQSINSMVSDVWDLDDNWWVKDGYLTADDLSEHGVYPTINA